LQSLKNQFPIFQTHPGWVYLDNAATTQRHESVLQDMDHFYRTQNASSGRGVYPLAHQATTGYENTRKLVADFIGALDAKSIVFNQGTTDGINQVAFGCIKPRLKKGDNLVITQMEHHSNWLPWHVIAKEMEAELRIIPVDKDGNLNLSIAKQMINSKTRILALTHISNVLGTINPIVEITKIAKKSSIPVLIDAAQSAALYDLNVHVIDCDFLIFSAHKMFAPFGLGILYVHPRQFPVFQPTRLGGGMIAEFSIQEIELLPFPHKMEAGTTNPAGVTGLNAAISFLNQLDRLACLSHLQKLTNYAIEKLKSISGLHLVGNPKHRSSIVSFYLDKIHAHDAATFLARENIAVRAGYHCAQPLNDFLGLSGTLRVSFSIYNESKDVDQLHAALLALNQFWK